MSITTTLFLTAALPLAACGGSQSKTPENPGEAPGPAIPGLVGQWQSACVPAPQPDGSTTYFHLDFDITAEAWKLDYTVHGDAACSAPLMTVHIEGPYEIGQPSGTVAGAHEAVFGFSDKTLTPHVQPLADMLSSMQCGPGAWTAGTTQSIYEAGCAGLGQRPRSACAADHDLVKVEGDTLHFGKRPADNDMCSPERRPAELNPMGFTRK
jgi:hypothetical protein